MRAAIICFNRQGFRRTSMEAIAEAAEVSRPALYQYYRNKDEVFRAAVRWGLEDLARRADRESRKPGGVADRLAAVLSVVLMMHFPRDGARFRAELVDETRARAGDHWREFEAAMISALVRVLRPEDGESPVPAPRDRRGSGPSASGTSGSGTPASSTAPSGASASGALPSGVTPPGASTSGVTPSDATPFGVTSSGMSSEDVAYLLLYGAKGIAMQLDERAEAQRRLRHLTEVVTAGFR
jgi:TetR/AcrR family transcriptional regulator